MELLGERYPLGIGSTAGDLISPLKDTYCGTIGYELAHVRDPEEKGWLQQAIESGGIHCKYDERCKGRLVSEARTRDQLDVSPSVTCPGGGHTL